MLDLFLLEGRRVVYIVTLACLSACEEDVMQSRDSDEILEIVTENLLNLDEDTFLEKIWLYLVSKDCVTEKEVPPLILKRDNSLNICFSFLSGDPT
jgi:hypothetical protein